jgi:hypothetical protein
MGGIAPGQGSDEGIRVMLNNGSAGARARLVGAAAVTVPVRVGGRASEARRRESRRARRLTAEGPQAPAEPEAPWGTLLLAQDSDC